MLPNPFQAILKTCDTLSQCIQSHISHFIDNYTHQSDKQLHPLLFRKHLPLFSLSSKPAPLQSKQEDEKEIGNSSYPISSIKGQPARPLSREELGRATWTLLHTLAAQFPDHPTKQQKRDVKELMAILSRLYPCKECADHFKEVLKANPVQAGSQAEFSQWLCRVHNVVNRSLGKVIFPCHRVDARWGKLECMDRACDLQGIHFHPVAAFNLSRLSCPIPIAENTTDMPKAPVLMECIKLGP